MLDGNGSGPELAFVVMQQISRVDFFYVSKDLDEIFLRHPERYDLTLRRYSIQRWNV